MNGQSSVTSPALSSSASRISSTHQERDEVLRLDPLLRLKLEKLETALRFLGLEPTAEQQAKMRRRLRMEQDDTVAYGEFVTLAQEIFRNDLPKFPDNVQSSREENIEKTSEIQAVDQLHVSSSSEIEMKWMNRKTDKLKAENDRLKSLLKERDVAQKTTEDELFRLREELQGAVNECRSLRSRLHLAENAQKAARSTEEDYEEVLRLLEIELHRVRHRDNRHKKDGGAADAELLELGHQLLKTEVERKMYKAATERLLQFTVSVDDHLSELLVTTMTTVGGEENTSNGDVGELRLKRSLPSQSSSQVIQFLASEAKNTTRAVKTLLEIDSSAVPFGEESTDLDGVNSKSRKPLQGKMKPRQQKMEASAPSGEEFTGSHETSSRLPKKTATALKRSTSKPGHHV